MAKNSDTYTAADMAEELGITPAELRKHLRSAGVEKPEGGWKWPNQKAAASVLKAVKARMDELSQEKPAKKAPKSGETSGGKKPTRKKTADAE